MTERICNWCNDKPVKLGNQWSCEDCTFICPECKQEVPYEQGLAECQSCDPCCISHGDNHIEY